MRDLNECKAEIFRRSEIEITKRKKRRSRMIAYCVPLFFCVTALVFANLPNDSSETADSVTSGTPGTFQTYSLESFQSTDETKDSDSNNDYSYGINCDTSNDHSRPEEAVDEIIQSGTASIAPETSIDTEEAEEAVDETSENDVSTFDSAATLEPMLEFSITQNVKGYDWSKHCEIYVYGYMGTKQYYGIGYEPIYSGYDSSVTPPKYYVTYLISAYPDYADGGEYVTEIRITDPKVKIFGLTTKSDIADFDSVFTNLGYTVTDGGSEIYPTRVATKGDITYSITKQSESTDYVPEIIISAKVTNREGKGD